jgi:mRNA interferase MazF
MLVNNERIERGNVYYADLGERQSSRDAVQRGKRPVLVVSNNLANKYSPAITIVPLTTRNKHHLPTHIEFGLPNHGEVVSNTALCEQVRTINVDQLYFKIGSLDDDIMRDVNNCLEVALAL